MTIIIVIIAGAGFVSSFLKMNTLEHRYNELATSDNQQLWDLITLNQYVNMSPNIKNITRDRKLKKAIDKKDTVLIKENATTAFNVLEGQKVLSNIQIMDNNGIILYDALNPATHSSTNQLALHAIQEKKNQTSITKNQQGYLQSELVFLITKRGKIIGAGSYTLKLNTAIDALKARHDSQVYIADTTGKLQSYSSINLDNELNALSLPFEQGKHLLIKQSGSAFSITILPIFNAKNELLSNLISIKDVSNSYNSQQTINISAILLLLVISAVSIVFIYWYLNQSLKPLHSISKSLTAVSEGNLTVVIEQSPRNDEIAEIQKAIANTINNLHQLISKISPLVSEVNNSSDLLTQTIQTNQKNIALQKDNIEQVSHATQGVESAVSSISQNSSQVMSHSHETNDELGKGSRIIHQTIDSIKKIASQVERSSSVINNLSEETESIVGILDVIKGIAEQTNLLALNAAIEAARAGEQGRGFAVVADEVRTLAGKTQESTLEIEEMIDKLRNGASSAVKEMENSRREVKSCVELSTQTEASLGIITPKVEEIKNSNIQINSSISEQKTAIEGITQNIITISNLSESNVESNSEAVNISNRLKEFSNQLEAMIDQFKV
ncbi:MAG: methyl-accepting chemotaxis protein [gamma proteobacterium symbiont of Taylorina sp.]|nr:methyl-accepting chemotaxis protein [gamma proteobacterium symbiont of Taylorina sp.]